MSDTASVTELATEALVSDVLATIDREREREIVARRFGLFDRKETAFVSLRSLLSHA
jgi:hypothetical protein